MIKTIFIRYFLLCKRLLKRASFVFMLLLIPAFSLITSIASSEDTGFVRIAVSCEDPSDDIAISLIDELQRGSNFLVFKEYESVESAINAVSSAKVDTAWIFPKDMKDRIADFADGRKTSLAKIYLSEDSMLVKASREKLFGALYSNISYEIYRNYVNDLGLPADRVTDEKLAESYEILSTDNGIISFEYLDSTTVDLDSYNYTTAPMRGLLVTVMLLCGMAATLFFLEDEQRHAFANMTPGARYLMFYGNNLAAVSISAVFVSVAIVLSGNYDEPICEPVSMVLLVLMTTGFTVLCGCVVRSRKIIGIMIPSLIVLSLALCPVFFSFVFCEPIQMLIPAYLYLYSISDPATYLLPMMVYILITAVLGFTTFKLEKR